MVRGQGLSLGFRVLGFGFWVLGCLRLGALGFNVLRQCESS